MKCHNECGNQWSKIRKYFPGRSDNSIRNRYNMLMRALNRKVKKDCKLKKKKQSDTKSVVKVHSTWGPYTSTCGLQKADSSDNTTQEDMSINSCKSSFSNNFSHHPSEPHHVDNLSSTIHSLSLEPNITPFHDIKPYAAMTPPMSTHLHHHHQQQQHESPESKRNQNYIQTCTNTNANNGFVHFDCSGPTEINNNNTNTAAMDNIILNSEENYQTQLNNNNNNVHINRADSCMSLQSCGQDFPFSQSDLDCIYFGLETDFFMGDINLNYSTHSCNDNNNSTNTTTSSNDSSNQITSSCHTTSNTNTNTNSNSNKDEILMPHRLSPVPENGTTATSSIAESSSSSSSPKTSASASVYPHNDVTTTSTSDPHVIITVAATHEDIHHIPDGSVTENYRERVQAQQEYSRHNQTELHPSHAPSTEAFLIDRADLDYVYFGLDFFDPNSDWEMEYQAEETC